MDCKLLDKKRKPATMSREEYQRMLDACDKAAPAARPSAPASMGNQPNTDEQGLPNR